MDESLEVLSVLSESPNRLRILKFLGEKRGRAADVEAELGIPQATANHNLKRLLEEGLIERTVDGYKTTTFGKYVSKQVDSCSTSISVAREIQPFLDIVPDAAFEYDLSALRGADVTTVEPADPHAPIDRFVELTRGVPYVRIITPTLVSDVIDTFHEDVVERGTELDLVVQADALKILQTKHAAKFEQALESGRLTVGIYSGPIPFSLSLLNDTITLGGHDEQKFLRCLVECYSETAIRWAEDVYREYQWDIERFVEPEDKLG